MRAEREGGRSEGGRSEEGHIQGFNASTVCNPAAALGTIKMWGRDEFSHSFLSEDFSFPLVRNSDQYSDPL